VKYFLQFHIKNLYFSGLIAKGAHNYYYFILYSILLIFQENFKRPDLLKFGK